MEVTIHSRIGEIVLKNYKTAKLFDSKKIDYCCKGERSLREACQEVDVDPTDIIKQILKIIGIKPTNIYDYAEKPLDEVCDYILEKEHPFIKESIDLIRIKLQKLNSNYGNQKTELSAFKQLFYDASEQLSMHYQKEELILFPYIKKLVEAEKNKLKYSSEIIGSISSPIKVLLEDHQIENNRFHSLSVIFQHFKPIENDCKSFIITYFMLQDFEAYLHKHIEFENNNLFRRALELEKKLMIS